MDDAEEAERAKVRWFLEQLEPDERERLLMLFAWQVLELFPPKKATSGY